MPDPRNRDVLLRPLAAEPIDDNCDECGRAMPLTGDSLCRSCAEADERRRTCLVCECPKIFLDETTCSDRCDKILEGWPEP